MAALRTDESGTDPAPIESLHLGPLLDEYRRAGLVVEDDLDPSIDGLRGSVATAAHRIVREALANVARHAPGNRVRVSGEQLDDGRIALAIADSGRPAAPAGPGPHFGITGMHERARAIGGDLDAGPTEDGWRVTATLPPAVPAPEPHR